MVMRRHCQVAYGWRPGVGDDDVGYTIGGVAWLNTSLPVIGAGTQYIVHGVGNPEI